jgi:hypothetical protein
MVLWEIKNLDRQIKGIQLTCSNIHCEISAFADDSTGIITDDYSINKFYMVEDLGLYSGTIYYTRGSSQKRFAIMQIDVTTNTYQTKIQQHIHQ